MISPGGAGRNRVLNKSSFLKLKVPHPPIEEQRKIAEILGTWDEAIVLTERMIAALEQRKKGLMQRLLTGQVRFPGFTEAWEEVKLGDVCEVLVSGVDKKTHKDELPVRLCNYMDVYNNEFITSDLDFMSATASDQEIEKYTLQIGDVIITKDSETREDIANSAVVLETSSDLICGYHLAILRPLPSQVNGIFLSKLVNSFDVHKHFVSYANGATRYGLSNSAITDAKIFIPSIKEQEKISELFLVIDEEIKNLNEELSQYQIQKKGLMQRLLTGEVRVNWGEIYYDY